MEEKIIYIMMSIVIILLIVTLVGAFIVETKIIKQDKCIKVNDKYYCEVK